MTNKEIHEMIKKYESKWGRLGHTNIMRPELNHSGEEGGTTMSSMTNDLIAFRQKVAAGREANRLAHKSTVNVTDINRRYFEEITTNGTLIHAGTNQNADYKYYQKLDLGNGQSRYFYTKAEWDAYQEGLKRTAYDDQNKVNAANKTSGGAKADAARENAKRNAYENTKSVPVKNETNNNKSVQNHFNNMRADVVNEYAKIAREASSKDAAKAFYDMGKGGNEAIDELYTAIQDGFKSGKLSYKDGRFETDDDQLKDDIEAFSNNIQKFAKQIGEASGKGREIQDELEKLMLPDIEAMSKKEQNTKKDNSRKQELAKDNKANRLDNGENVKTNETNFSEDKKKGEELITGDSKEAQEMRMAYNDLWDESWKGDYDHSNYQEGANRQFKSLYKTAKLLEMYGMNPSDDLKSAYSYIKPNSKEGQNIIKEADKEFEEFMKSHKHLEKYFSNKEVKHSSEEPEIMDEYSAFMERVKKGREKNKLAHSIMISPSDLNARYEQSIKDHCFLVHGGTFKYYNKIDLGNGQSRYFYTKAEWDAYQEGLKQTAQAKQNAPKKEEPAKKEEPIKNPDGWSADKALKEHFDKKKEEEGRAGMTGYSDWKKKQEAKSKADERNNMDGYADWKKEQDAKKTENVKKAQSGREAAEKAGQKATQELQAKEKKLQENIKDRDRMSANADKIDKEIQEADKEQNLKVEEKEKRKKEIIQDYYKNNPDSTSFSEDFNKTVDERGKSNFTVTVHPDGEMVIYAPEFDKAIKEFDGEYKKYLKNFKTVSDKLKNGEYKDEYERRQLESDREFWRLNYFEKLAKVVELENRKQMLAYDEFDSVCRQMGINFDKYNLNEREGKYKK